MVQKFRIAELGEDTGTRSTAKVIEGAPFRGVDRHGHVASTGLHRDSIAAIFKTAAARAGAA